MTFHSISEIYALLPGQDCGLCGNPICLTLARKVAAGAQSPNDCKIINPENISKINGMVEEGIEKVSIKGRNKDGMTEIHPCTEDGKVTLEVQWESENTEDQPYTYDFFSPHDMCEELSDTAHFDLSKCSPELGYAFCESNGKRLHIFKTGRIIMRRAKNKKDAINTINHVASILWPLRICSCGNILIDCFGGACEECSSRKCPVLSDLYSNEASYLKITLAGALDDKKRSEVVPLFLEGLDYSRSAIENMENLTYDTIETAMENNYKQARKLIEMRSILGFVLLGISRDMRRICDALLKLKEHDEQRYYDKAMGMILTLRDLLKNLDEGVASSLSGYYEKYVKNWEPPTPVEMAKVVANSYYILRLFNKPMPDLELTYIKENDM